MIRTSGKLTPAAFMSTTTSPGPGTGSGASSKTRVSGGPCCLQSNAFMRNLLERSPAMVMPLRGSAHRLGQVVDEAPDLGRQVHPVGIGGVQGDADRRE